MTLWGTSFVAFCVDGAMAEKIERKTGELQEVPIAGDVIYD
jgi:hypothetical protein